MTATRWWSVSKQTWLVLEDMHDNHILNAARVLDRGGYRVPIEYDPTETIGGPVADTREPEPMELAHLKRTVDAELRRRKIGPYRPAEPPQDEGFA